jgi:hypothetical protein
VPRTISEDARESVLEAITRFPEGASIEQIEGMPPHPAAERCGAARTIAVSIDQTTILLLEGPQRIEECLRYHPIVSIFL